MSKPASSAGAVGGRVEVDAERRRRRVERHRQLVHERRLGGGRVDRVDAAAVADAVELPVLDAEVDADELRVAADEAEQPPVVRETDGLEAPHARAPALAEAPHRMRGRRRYPAGA
jgi:hypothetical protein